MNYCNDCNYLNKETLKCDKFKIILPCNIDLNVHKCERCREENNEGKDKIRHDK